MISKFFETQRKNPTRKDWVTTVKNDLEELKMDLTFEDIKVLRKNEFKAMIKRKIQNKAMENLEQRKKITFQSQAYPTWIFRNANLSKINQNTNDK